jgi:hypothetical protein
VALTLTPKQAKMVVHGAKTAMANPTAPLPVFGDPGYITVGDPYSDAYSGKPKVEQASTEAKTPFSSGLKPASRHRGAQFINSNLHEGAYPSNNTGDPYADGWKRAHRHYQRDGSRIEVRRTKIETAAPKRIWTSQLRFRFLGKETKNSHPSMARMD